MPYAVLKCKAPRGSPELQVKYAVPLTDSRVGDALYELIGIGVREGNHVRLPDGRIYAVYSDGSASLEIVS